MKTDNSLSLSNDVKFSFNFSEVELRRGMFLAGTAAGFSALEKLMYL